MQVMRWPFVIAILWALLGLPAAAADRALIVGVGQYPGIYGQDGVLGHNNLKGPKYDAVHMHDLLVQVLGYSDDNVKVLIDADRQQILDAAKSWLVDGTQPGDRVFFYFSGHGSPVDVDDGKGGKRVTSAIVPHDARAKVEGDKYVTKNLILGTEIHALIEQMPGRQVTVVADSCFSGSIIRGTTPPGPLPGTIRTISDGSHDVVLSLDQVTPDLLSAPASSLHFLDFNRRSGGSGEVAGWSAASTGQYSYDLGEEGGQFTKEFIEGLRNPGADAGSTGRVTASSLLAFLQDKAKTFCGPKNCNGMGLTPGLDAPGPYLASVLVPYAPAPATPAPPPEGPAIVDLAQGLLSHTNDFDMTAAILPGSTIKLGATVRFRVTSAETGRLIIFDTGPDGKMRRIFPNDYSEAAGKNGTIRENAPLTIPDDSYPFEFTATDAGDGALLVLVGEQDMDFSSILSGTSAFEPSSAPDKPLIAIAADLQEPVIDPEGNEPTRAHRWAFTTVKYTVQ